MKQNRNNNRPKEIRHFGTVKMWNRERGFGFIIDREDGESYYCSKKVINDEPYLLRGTIVEFGVGHGEDKEGNRTNYAYNVMVVEIPER